MARKSAFGAEPEQVRELLSFGLEDSNNHGTGPTASLGAILERPGGQIGRYKLLSVLGEGGMGIVYLAEQEEPISRKVALKVIKPGMDSKAVIARFEAERQALALLEHPNVAHVYDAGTTHTGRPYFVMEYVKGIPITEHCDRQKLTLKERLELFLKVCEAVQHAHLNGIIHRDLKPSNVQVAIQGQQSIPKVIDFGVAKATNRLLTERTLVTEQGQFVGTPEYMSPEQAEMTGQDVDTRSDVYSLGVLLYELLTGILPFDPKSLRERGFDHIRRVIREEDPKTPSTRLSKISRQDSTKLAKLRHTDVRTLERQLHGDLDWITLKAMEKDRTRRYQTAHALTEDIQRHLNNEPVLAGPPSIVYRLKKYVQKHRTQAIGTAVAAALLAVIAVISVLLAQAVDRSRQAHALEHKEVLSKATEYRSKGQYEDALAKLGPILHSEHVGPEARWLHAQTVLQLRGPTEAIKLLEKLTNEPDDIASQAHLLLARIYLETDPGDPDAVQEYQRKGREHQQKGEDLFSETAEAYLNRAMMAGTVDKNLEYLSEALRLDSGHYPSLRARALGYYALRDYRNMERDAVAMTTLKNWDSLGYSLVAIALREVGDFADALKYHDRAIEISPEEAELFDQRRQTHLRMGNLEHVLEDAKECVRLQPDETVYHFHVFCALVALGRFEQAQAISESKGAFGGRANKYVFDTLAAGQSWHPPGNKPTGVAFLPMVEADEYYRRLAEKGARRIAPDGYAPAWSPDGTQVVYSRGIHGFSGIETVNVKTGKTRLLVVSGFDPVWSPDGNYIAFVRHRQILSLADFTSEHPRRNPSAEQREIWLVKADGTEEPRFLARGHQPGWHANSRQVFYWWVESMNLCSIAIEPGSKPQEIAWCPANYPSVSADGKFVAFSSTGDFTSLLYVMDLSSRTVIASWAGPQKMQLADWSWDGRTLTTGNLWGSHGGVWTYDLERREVSKILSGRIVKGRLSPDGSRMVVGLGPPYREIWIADVAPLVPGETFAEHHQAMVGQLTSRIDAYPRDTRYYLRRAAWNIRLGNIEEALTDIENHAELVNDPYEEADAYDKVAWDLVRMPQETNPDIAVELYRRAHELLPEHWRYLCGLGAAHYRMGQWNKAITELTRSRERAYGTNGLTYLLLAMAHWQQGEKSVAKSFHNKAMEWMEHCATGWVKVERDWTIYSIYVEACELMGTKVGDFSHTHIPVGKIDYDDANDTYTVLGAGRDIWGSADQFHYAHGKLNGDGFITARVDSVEHVHKWTKAGVMIRDTSAPDSQFAAVFVTPENQICLQYRSSIGEEARGIKNYVSLPCWVKLIRKGRTFKAQHSDDGMKWNDIEEAGPTVTAPKPAEVDIKMNDPVYVGLAVCSHAGPGIPAKARISNVTTTGDVDPPGESLKLEGIGFNVSSPSAQ